MVYFNPRAPCGARPSSCPKQAAWRGISIHAPRAGRDLKMTDLQFDAALFQSTRPVRGATSMFLPHPDVFQFQSTRPVRGATAISRPGRTRPAFQSTRPVRGATLLLFIISMQHCSISIHAPRAGRDIRLPVHFSGICISIHAPRAGRDYITTEIGLRPLAFQSTRPVRGATAAVDQSQTIIDISIHAPRAGRDPKLPKRKEEKTAYFNPRAPCGARPAGSLRSFCCRQHFNPRAPCGARQQNCTKFIAQFCNNRQ